MRDASFWRGPFSAQSEMIDVAASIALSRFREAGVGTSYVLQTLQSPVGDLPDNVCMFSLGSRARANFFHPRKGFKPGIGC